ncbi:hypothetical protein [Streptomyces sp. WMMB 322]|uniref:hypothetical protein n=1 Tax=Streptomyces sp. WMMB 322 TaxID=1286821 RepID=UPI0006E1F541|nr:hypothetical protein [Streptomyces sp. WMMB 322]SCK08455.1 hypothetical protein H180DRAFT_00373 [Streptomyces sp. WMMB 322]
MGAQTFRSAALGTLAALSALGLTLAASSPGVAAGAAKKNRAPGFLSPADLPPHPSSPWFAGKVTAGLPDTEPFCVEGELPASRSHHREFHTELDTNATQVGVVAASTGAAKKLAASLKKSVAACAADWLRETPGGTASWDDYGGLAVGNGAHVYGVSVSVPESETNVHLFGVGRDGKAVTVVRWGQMGDLGDAPLADFKRTTRTAVSKLN